MMRPLLTGLVLVLTLSACGKATHADAKKDEESTPVQLMVAPEDLIHVQDSTISSGPIITGSIQPERKADLRSEVSAVVVQVLKENGDAVHRGDVLVKMDETSIRDNLNSAEDNARSASLALDQAQRSLQRLKTLRESGMSSAQALDDAEVRLNTARAELSASNARAATARQQLTRTVVRAPFDGVVSERKVSAGDTASIGKELLKVIDPSSMRFSGRISADKVGQVKVGQAVNFRINGYAGQNFKGKVTRVDPSANDVTRQVEVLVGFADSNRPKVSGLYAEGVIESAETSAIALPETALVRAGDKTSVWRVKDLKLAQVDLVVGPRDARTGYCEVRSGLATGDMVLRNPRSSFKDGQAVTLASDASPAQAKPASDKKGV